MIPFSLAVRHAWQRCVFHVMLILRGATKEDSRRTLYCRGIRLGEADGVQQQIGQRYGSERSVAWRDFHAERMSRQNC
jgi:hypothetical protein